MIEALSRDESWVKFNERVLQEAQNSTTPLLERIKFLAIYSSNFDEFFQIRISRLRKLKLLTREERLQVMEEPDGKPNVKLKTILDEVKELQEQFESTFFKKIVPELKTNGIELLFPNTIDEQQSQFLLHYYKEELAPKLSITSIQNDDDFPFLENHKLYFILVFSDGQMSLCNIPSELPRFTEVPCENNKALIFLDDIIRIGLKETFKDNYLMGCFQIKLSRDADIDIEDEFDGNLVEKIKTELTNRGLGLPTRLLYDKLMPDFASKQIRKRLGLKSNDLIPGGHYHNFSDLFDFPNLTENKTLEYQQMPPLPHPFLEGKKIIEVVKQKDVLLSFPYQKFDYIPQLILEASNHVGVTHIKITLYRISKNSTVANHLLYALKKGKKVTVFIEVKARFDESNNIYWGNQLEQAGAKVIYSYPTVKVHTKILLIEMMDNQAQELIAYIGTGNFNERTSKIYCDHGILTSDPLRANEIKDVFNLLEGKLLIPKPKHLLISPYNTRSTFQALIKQEIQNQKAGKQAFIILKMNSLEDPELIEELYNASRAGVSIKLIVRGLCCLVPGIPNQSETITVISIVDRFLEHARIYRFCNAGDEIIYIGSADWMTRNLDKRIEVLTPVHNKHIQNILKDIVDIQLADNQKARIIDALQTNQFVEEKHPTIRSQNEIYNYFKIVAITNRLPDEFHPE